MKRKEERGENKQDEGSERERDHIEEGRGGK